MTDRELLELAAKAAGLEIDWDVLPKSPPWVFTGKVEDRGPAYQWNPLTDDGDALRLAVKLGLDVCIDTEMEFEPHTHVIGFSSYQSSTTLDAIEHHGDPYAATRRAITRAAAEIGKTFVK